MSQTILCKIIKDEELKVTENNIQYGGDIIPISSLSMVKSKQYIEDWFTPTILLLSSLFLLVENSSGTGYFLFFVAPLFFFTEIIFIIINIFMLFKKKYVATFLSHILGLLASIVFLVVAKYISPITYPLISYLIVFCFILPVGIILLFSAIKKSRIRRLKIYSHTGQSIIIEGKNDEIQPIENAIYNLLEESNLN